MPRSNSIPNRSLRQTRTPRVRSGHGPSGRGMAAYARREWPLVAPAVTVPSQGAVMPSPGAIIYPDVAKEIQDLSSAIRRIELHLGIAPLPATGELRALGWSPEKIELTRAKLACVEEDWNDPAMDVYDEL